MRFHLPAYLIASIKGEVDDPMFTLTYMGVLFESRFATLNALQKKAVTQYLTWCLTEDEYQFYDEDIVRALTEYWEK
jgi:hypothetical protein